MFTWWLPPWTLHAHRRIKKGLGIYKGVRQGQQHTSNEEKLWRETNLWLHCCYSFYFNSSINNIVTWGGYCIVNFKITMFIEISMKIFWWEVTSSKYVNNAATCLHACAGKKQLYKCSQQWELTTTKSISPTVWFRAHSLWRKARMLNNCKSSVTRYL